MGSELRKWMAPWEGEWAAWRDRRETQSAIEKFEALTGTDRDRIKTIYRIAIACNNASKYEPGKDPGLKYREEMSHQCDRTHQLAKAAHLLAKACERDDRALSWALPGGTNPLSVRLSRPHDGAFTPIHLMGAAWFTELEQRILGKIPELHGGPFWHRFTVGNLHFDRPLRSGRPIEVASMLAFELSFYLRMFTAGRAGDLTQSGQRQPSDGKPCCHVIAEFCNATLSTNFDASMIGDRLRKLPRDVGLIEWPKGE